MAQHATRAGRKMSSVERRNEELRQRAKQASEGFDVTCKIGRIEPGEGEPGEGDLNAFEAAFVMIARHDSDGVYHFAIPSDQGASYEVSVQRHEPVKPDPFDSAEA